MRHKKAGRQFGRDTSSRRAMFRNLTANLITHERIETTDAKAKELRRVAERLISKAMRLGKVAYTPQSELSAGDKAKRLHVTRLLSAFVPRFGVRADGTKVDIVEKVMLDLTKRFDGRPGGYTRIIKLGNRRGDNAPMVYIEFIDAALVVDKAAPEEVPAVTAAEPAEAVAAVAAETSAASTEGAGETSSNE